MGTPLKGKKWTIRRKRIKRGPPIRFFPIFFSTHSTLFYSKKPPLVEDSRGIQKITHTIQEIVMKSSHLLRFLLVLFTLALTLQTFADSGKFWIGRPGPTWSWPEFEPYHPSTPVTPPAPSGNYNNQGYNQGGQNNSTNSGTPISLITNKPTLESVTQDNDPDGMVIENFDEDNDDDEETTVAVFSEERQQAIIAWNGHTDKSGEEVLILTTNEQINEEIGKSAITLNVVPLPGEPIDVLPADSKIFEKTKKVLEEKYTTKALGSGFPAVMHKKVGSHDIFVWRIDEKENFRNALLTYVKEEFKGKFVIDFKPKMEATINTYFDRGFKYFAFDLSHVEEENTTREAIAYHFRSRFLYFPLVISKIGGMPDSQTLVDMIIMTPKKIHMKPIKTNKGKTYSDDTLPVLYNEVVKFTLEEVKELDPTLAEVLRGNREVTVRNVILTGDLIGFQNDFMAIGAQ
ncbi:MAG: hypothetical protein IJQ31_12970 [Thermoguttaceae bacterium]|nr:hypothetical protein [Thermoguttaceae bacterium]